MADPRPLPRVTVVMPIRNEAGFIARSLGAVLAQDYPRHLLDVIVADGCSDDDTRSIVETIATQDGRVTIIDNEGRIVASGLNRALAMATGEVIVRVDGHCEIAADYVRCCVTHLRRGGVAGVGGPLDTVGTTPVARAVAAAMSSMFGVGNSAFRTLKGTTRFVDTIAFGAYTREALAYAGRFDTELVRNQDDEYNYRLRRLGCRLLLASDVRAQYFSRGSLQSLARQYFQYGYWKVRVLQKHPRQMSLRQFVPPAFVIALLALPFIPGGLRIWAALLATYIAAVMGASIVTARRLREREAWSTLPIAFVILHIAYGAGFLTGLLKFALRWGRDAAPTPNPVPAFESTRGIAAERGGHS
ncbi:MAG: glycosyltransferase family 2 protein [Acidobacteria bacterium]|nr:glycosyltransferase family 2 protein [Acidobacteriota bacterium]